jgi:hypothetical protein
MSVIRTTTNTTTTTTTVTSITSTTAINSLTPELNSSAQRCMTRFFTGDFAS